MPEYCRAKPLSSGVAVEQNSNCLNLGDQSRHNSSLCGPINGSPRLSEPKIWPQTVSEQASTGQSYLAPSAFAKKQHRSPFAHQHPAHECSTCGFLHGPRVPRSRRTEPGRPKPLSTYWCDTCTKLNRQKPCRHPIHATRACTARDRAVVPPWTAQPEL